MAIVISCSIDLHNILQLYSAQSCQSATEDSCFGLIKPCQHHSIDQTCMHAVTDRDLMIDAAGDVKLCEVHYLAVVTHSALAVSQFLSHRLHILDIQPSLNLLNFHNHCYHRTGILHSYIFLATQFVMLVP